jgi:hypothetical protein
MGPDRLHVSTTGFSKSFGGGLAQVWATEASDPERRAWSSAGEFDSGGCAHAGPEQKRAPLPAQFFCAGRGRGERGKLGAAERVTSLD